MVLDATQLTKLQSILEKFPLDFVQEELDELNDSSDDDESDDADPDPRYYLKNTSHKKIEK